MIAACPKCEARYRVDESQIGAEGARLKCAKCQAVFRVQKPAAPQVPAAPKAAPVAPQPVAAATPPPATAQAPQAPAPKPAPVSPEVGGVVDRSRLIVIADPSVESGKRTVHAISNWGLQAVLVHDGVEAMLTIQRMLPRAVVLDAALPKMFGFQVCEVIKRNDSLRDMGVVLVGAIHNRDRYHRPPADLYGADVYLEHPDLPEGLEPILKGFGITLEPVAAEASAPPVAAEPRVTAPAATPAPVAPPPAPEPVVAPAAVPTPTPPPEVPAVEAAGGELAEERAKAERLARIVASDIVLYQPDKFAAAVKKGNVVEAMDAEIEEARGLFRDRIDERVREECDFIVEELVRVARQRGMQ